MWRKTRLAALAILITAASASALSSWHPLSGLDLRHLSEGEGVPTLWEAITPPEGIRGLLISPLRVAAISEGMPSSEFVIPHPEGAFLSRGSLAAETTRTYLLSAYDWWEGHLYVLRLTCPEDDLSTCRSTTLASTQLWFPHYGEPSPYWTAIAGSTVINGAELRIAVESHPNGSPLGGSGPCPCPLEIYQLDLLDAPLELVQRSARWIGWSHVDAVKGPRGFAWGNDGRFAFVGIRGAGEQQRTILFEHDSGGALMRELDVTAYINQVGADLYVGIGYDAAGRLYVGGLAGITQSLSLLTYGASGILPERITEIPRAEIEGHLGPFFSANPWDIGVDRDGSVAFLGRTYAYEPPVCNPCNNRAYAIFVDPGGDPWAYHHSGLPADSVFSSSVPLPTGGFFVGGYESHPGVGFHAISIRFPGT